MDNVLVSACLVGFSCRFDGKSTRNRIIQSIVQNDRAIAVCPEQLGGLPTPRSSCMIVGGDGFDVIHGKAKVISETGEARTDNFLLGAEKTITIARNIGIRRAVLKERSPSCGVCNIYCGEKLIHGCGVTTAMLLEAGIQVESAEEKTSITSVNPGMI